jgi:hypothetical protein
VMRSIYKLLSILGDVKATSKGPEALAKRKVNQFAHKQLAKGLRKMWK